jgi:hypothetical protein
MRSHLPTRGTIRRWWRLARTHPAVRQLLQRGHERVEPRLVRGRRHPVVPGGGTLKDRLGDRRGGSEWEPIKILL